MAPAGRDLMGKPFFITTAIDYTNAAPHVGHAALLAVPLCGAVVLRCVCKARFAR